MGDDQPTIFGLDGRASIANLDEFPGVNGLLDDFGFVPDVDAVRIGDVVVDAVYSAQHGVLPVDFPGEQGHPFVLGNFAIDGQNLEIIEVGCFD